MTDQPPPPPGGLSTSASRQLPASASGRLSASASGWVPASAAGRLSAASARWLSAASTAGWLSSAPPPGGYPPPPSRGGYPPAARHPPGAAPAESRTASAMPFRGRGTSSARTPPAHRATLVYGLVVIVLQSIINLVSAAVSPTDYSSYSSDATSFSFSYGMSGVGSIIVSIIGWFLSLIVAAALQSAYIGGILDIANGQEVSIGSFFRRGTSAMSSSRV